MLNRLLRPKLPALPPEQLRQIADSAATRLDLWSQFVQAAGIRRMAEIGVYRGDYAARLLADADALTTYYMIDPWKHLEDWNKPANKRNKQFQRFFDETMEKTEAWSGKRKVLRGRTADVVGDIPDGSLDFIYVDGDHTLRGITIDLVKAYDKVRPGGWLGGDDFSPTIWQHGDEYEPTLVFPFALYFAEAVDATVYGLPHRQFLIHKRAGFEFVDMTDGRYEDADLLSQVAPRASN
jgi:Methyltransferase domain